MFWWNIVELLRHDVGFDRQFVYVDMSQKQGNVELNKKEGDDKKKEKSPMKWHGIDCDGSVKKKDSKVPVYNHSRLRRSGRQPILVLNQKQVPQGLSRTTLLTCATRKMTESCLHFYVFFYMLSAFCYILLDIVVLWIKSCFE